jgi:transposase
MYGVIAVTPMPRSPATSDPKATVLRRAGALHPHPERVRDPAFLEDPFFDPRDRVQVRYEMVRRHRVERRPVTEVAAAFSVSRQAFYEASAAFEAEGLPGLVPKRPGPKRAHKCSDEILDFAEGWSGAGQDTDLTTAIAQRFHVTIHPRSLARALARRKKKRVASPGPR